MGTQCAFACPAASASHLPPGLPELKATRITNFEQILLFLTFPNKLSYYNSRIDSGRQRISTANMKTD